MQTRWRSRLPDPRASPEMLSSWLTRGCVERVTAQRSTRPPEPSSVPSLCRRSQRQLKVVPLGRTRGGPVCPVLDIRGQANGAGRQRLSQESQLKAVRPPRALPVVTGEQVLGIKSALARTLLIEVRPGDIDKEALGFSQKAADRGICVACTSAYLQWLAGRYPEIRSPPGTACSPCATGSATGASARRWSTPGCSARSATPR